MTKKTWSQKLAMARDMKAKRNAALYDRVRLLIEVYEDEDFVADCAAREENPEDVLDGEVDDTCTDFLTLRAVFDRFPKKEDWERTPLVRLVAVVSAEEDAKRKAATRNRMSWKKKALELQEELDKVRAENLRLKAELERTRAELAATKRALRNAEVRIEVMERLLQVQAQPEPEPELVN